LDAQSPAGQAFAARCLLRAAKWATLATVRSNDAGASGRPNDAGGGSQPFASLVTPAVAADGTILLLLSALAEHTRQLMANPCCALMAVGEKDTLNWQTAPRVTVTGVAAIVEDRPGRHYWLARHPYARLYADFTDFSLWRLKPEEALFVGGFGQAARLTWEALLPAGDAVASVAAVADGLIAHCNTMEGEALNRLAHAGGARGDWRMMGVDPDGLDLVQDETVLRCAFDAPVCSGAAAAAALQRLTAAAAQRDW
jgi:putative heme iron utilization protein